MTDLIRLAQIAVVIIMLGGTIVFLVFMSWFLLRALVTWITTGGNATETLRRLGEVVYGIVALVVALILFALFGSYLQDLDEWTTMAALFVGLVVAVFVAFRKWFLKWLRRRISYGHHD